jgi:TPP-dependent pyruvate/acetoin dehydrogenase alpha subunit
VDNVADRAIGYGFAGKVVEGNDILAVWHTMREALYRARTGAGPTLVECKTYRWHGHSEHDKAMYRTEEELIEWKSRDPIPRYEIYLREKHILSDDSKTEVAEQAKKVVADAVEFAEKEPEPTEADALTNVFGPPQAAE